MQSVLDRCQTAIQSQNVQLVAQGNEITRLSQSVNEVKNVSPPTVQNNTGIAASLLNTTALNTPEPHGVQARPKPTCNSQKAKSARSGVCFTCGQSGHYARDHRQSNINRPNDDSLPTNQSRGITADDSSADVYLRARLNGKNVNVLLDTGSEKNVCGKHLIPELKITPTNQRLLAADVNVM